MKTMYVININGNENKTLKMIWFTFLQEVNYQLAFLQKAVSKLQNALGMF